MVTDTRPPAVNSERLRALFDDIKGFGGSAGTAGFNRIAFSDADMEARRWLARQMEEAGLAVRWDGAGNVFGRWGDPEAAAIMVGSHLDTVAEGGAFDGAVGVCAAFECVRAMREAGVEPIVPVEIVATSGGAGRFGAALGARAMIGEIGHGWIENAADINGLRLVDAMERQQLNASAILDAARPPGSVRAFLQLDVEQGPVLEANGQTIGVVEAASGLCNWRVTMTGVAHHSGTTPMEMRSDAFAGLAEIAATIPSIIRIVGGANSRVTIGRVELSPNRADIVPSRAIFELIIRDTSEKVMKGLAAAFRSLINRVATSRILDVAVEEAAWVAPAELDAGLARTIEQEAKRLDLAYMRLASGAGHDAEVMQALCPSALIFVPSRNGIAHAPQEWTDWAHFEQGAALLLATLCRLCQVAAAEGPVAVAAPAIPPEGREQVKEAEDGHGPSIPDADEAKRSEEPDKKKTAEEEDEDDLDFDFELDEIALREDD